MLFEREKCHQGYLIEQAIVEQAFIERFELEFLLVDPACCSNLDTYFMPSIEVKVGASAIVIVS